MSKNSDKANNFPVSEAIDAAAHFDASAPRAGIVELLSGNEAMSKFVSMRADGQYFKPHQIYFAVYKPKSEYQVPVADHMSFESDMTIDQVEDKYNPIEPFIEGMSGDTQYPLPKGTPFFMKYFKDSDVDRFGIYGTDVVEVADPYYKKTGQRMRTYIATRIIPKMGRSILRANDSKFGMKTKANTTEAITCTEVTSDGSVCGGVFRKDSRGDYVCQNCGIIYEREDKFVAEDLLSNNEEFEYDDEDNLEEGTTQKDLEVGGVLPASMAAVEGRLSRNLAKFRAERATAPRDEVAAKAHAHEVKVADTSARKVFASMKGHEVYENKWSKSKAKSMAARVLHTIKVDGVNTVSGLTKALGVHNMYVVRAVDALVLSGRITREESGTTGKGKVITVSYVVTGKEHNGRAPAVMVMPVLPQVKYGGVARHSDMGSIYQSRCSVCEHKFYATEFHQFICSECSGQ
jgi:hypothetical protein